MERLLDKVDESGWWQCRLPLPENEGGASPAEKELAGMTTPLIPEVMDRMPWKCLDCGAKFLGPTNRPPVKGCVVCGSRQLFDCNVEFAGSVVASGPLTYKLIEVPK